MRRPARNLLEGLADHLNETMKSYHALDVTPEHRYLHASAIFDARFKEIITNWKQQVLPIAEDNIPTNPLTIPNS